MTVDERGQLVLAAGAMLAVALAPVALAYLQLSYAPGAAVVGPDDDPAREALSAMDDATVAAAAEIAGEYPWTAREAAARDANRSLWVTAKQLEGSQVESGVARTVAFNASAAGDWASDSCPRGPNRRFGDCEAVGGLVLQERAGEATLVAVAVDVRATDERGWTAVTAVVEVNG